MKQDLGGGAVFDIGEPNEVPGEETSNEWLETVDDVTYNGLE